MPSLVSLLSVPASLPPLPHLLGFSMSKFSNFLKVGPIMVLLASKMVSSYCSWNLLCWPDLLKRPTVWLQPAFPALLLSPPLASISHGPLAALELGSHSSTSWPLLRPELLFSDHLCLWKLSYSSRPLRSLSFTKLPHSR